MILLIIILKTMSVLACVLEKRCTKYSFFPMAFAEKENEVTQYFLHRYHAVTKKAN